MTRVSEQTPVPAAADPVLPGSGDPVLVLEGVTREFRSLWGRRRVLAVDGLSLEVRRGEVFGLLGPNGSGKTTTIQIILGLLAPSQGRLAVFGSPPGHRSVRARLGYLPEEFTGSDHLSGEETLLYYGSFYGLGGGEVARRAEALLRELDLWPHRRRRLREYSQGMRRRIGLAQSLLHDPELVILDEPTSGLDPLGVIKVKRILADLRARNRTVLITSHILPDMEDVCDRVAILHRGRRLVVGAVRDLLIRTGRHRLLVEGPAPRKEDAARLLAPAGLVLREVEPDRSSLEEVFLERLRAAEAAEGERSSVDR